MSNKSSIVDGILGSLRPSGNGAWYRGSCPFCELEGHVDKKHSFGVHAESGSYNCFRCGTSGKLKQAPDFQTRPIVVEPLEKSGPPEGYSLLYTEDALRSSCLQPARDYIQSRNVSTELAIEAGIGAVVTGRYHSRVIVPVIEEGDWVGWVGRSWVPKAEMPYIYPTGSWRGSAIYNSQALNVETDEPLVIVEGAFDALYLWPNAIAVLGKPSEIQIQRIKQAKRPISVVFDGDAIYESYSLALLLMMSGCKAGCVLLPPRLDPDEIEKETLLLSIHKSITEGSVKL